MKTTITRRITLPFLLIILFSFISVIVMFRVGLERYSMHQIKKNLLNATQNIRMIMRDDILNKKQFKTFSGEVEADDFILNEKAMREIRQIVQKSSFSFRSQTIIVDKQTGLLFPKSGSNEDTLKVIEKIIPELDGESQEVQTKTIRIDDKEYTLAFRPFLNNNELSAKPRVWIVVYTDNTVFDELISSTMYIMIIIIVIATACALAAGVIIARSIASPIIKLKERAAKLARRDFETKLTINTNDEIQELAVCMNEVADNLRNYDISQKNFIQNASHELKTPLMSIQGYAEGIKDEVFQDKEKALDVIIEESQRLRTLVEEIIYLSKIESSGQPIRLEKKRLNEVIDRSIEKISGIMVGNTIKIEKRYFSDNWLLIDEDKMTRAFINILGNCLRYSESVITIEVSDSHDSCKIKIKDDGPGFDIHEEDKIFERFYKGKKGNTGLGLAITKAIIEKHSGSIRAYNCELKGACFEIILPL